ncbi:unnamed protein product [Trichogramma brassicae]|uniref:Uncharacterized protein n=1 Tax=Trichogramma brassicae TaxID=86971 RepID=A0A6H5HYS4_9HYME|nr:unnamed protein product [Trichogramma brassicae]
MSRASQCAFSANSRPTSRLRPEAPHALRSGRNVSDQSYALLAGRVSAMRYHTPECHNLPVLEYLGPADGARGRGVPAEPFTAVSPPSWPRRPSLGCGIVWTSVCARRGPLPRSVRRLSTWYRFHCRPGTERALRR